MKSKNRLTIKKGQVFNHLTIIQEKEIYIDVNGKKYRVFECKCACGNIKTIRLSNIVSGSSKSCGCRFSNKKRIRKSKNPEYRIWSSMKHRCLNKNSNCYHLYGGRGVKVCERWMKFENFFSDMGKRPSKQHSIDRIDNDGNYCPENCRWATPKEQGRNRRTNRNVKIDGKVYCITDASIQLGLKPKTVIAHLSKGKPIAQALKINPKRID